MKGILYLTAILLILSSCGKDDQEQAVDSLLGEWTVTEIYYEEGSRIELGIIPDTSFTTSQLGEYIFFESETSVSYNYSVNGEMKNSAGIGWSVELEKRKNGFTNKTVYNIQIQEKIYEVQFGDETNDAHINATSAKLIFYSNPNTEGPYFTYLLNLVKKT